MIDIPEFPSTISIRNSSEETTMDEREKEVREAAKEFLIDRGYNKHAVHLPRAKGLKSRFFDRASEGVIKIDDSMDEQTAIAIVTSVAYEEALEDAKKNCDWYPSEDDTVKAELVREECGVRYYDATGLPTDKYDDVFDTEYRYCEDSDILRVEANVSGRIGVVHTVSSKNHNGAFDCSESETAAEALKQIGIDEVIE